MAYIESLFYYVLIVSIAFVVIFSVVFVVFFIVKTIQSYFEKRSDDNHIVINRRSDYLFGKRLVRFIVKHRFVKIFSLLYVVTFVSFYFIQSFEYYGSDRAYPKAKAYKIVADVNNFFFETFFASRNLYYKPSGVKYINAYEKLQRFFINKGFEYIPKEDGERAIWEYEYLYANYVRAKIAPIDFEKLDEREKRLLIIMDGANLIHKPIAREMLHKAGDLVGRLMENEIKDKTYDEIYRYSVATLFAVWIEQMRYLYYSLHTYAYKNPKMSERIKYINKVRYGWVEDNNYLKRVKKLSGWIDDTIKKVESTKALQNFLNQHKYIFPDMMALRVAMMSRIVLHEMYYKGFSCESENIQKYIKYRKEFIWYAKNNKVYKKFSKKEKRRSEKLYDYEDNFFISSMMIRYCGVTQEEFSYEDKIDMNWYADEMRSEKRKQILERINNEYSK
jgi:hypothetical protein